MQTLLAAIISSFVLTMQDKMVDHVFLLTVTPHGKMIIIIDSDEDS